MLIFFLKIFLHKKVNCGKIASNTLLITHEKILATLHNFLLFFIFKTSKRNEGCSKFHPQGIESCDCGGGKERPKKVAHKFSLDPSPSHVFFSDFENFISGLRL